MIGEEAKHFVVVSMTIWCTVGWFMASGTSTAIDMKYHPGARLRQRLGFIIRNAFDGIWLPILIWAVTFIVPAKWFEYEYRAIEAATHTVVGDLLFWITVLLLLAYFVWVCLDVRHIIRALFGIEKGLKIVTRRDGS
jgi:hypothetical protein